MRINKVSDIRQEFINLLSNQIYVEDKSGVKMLEIVSASFIADEDTIFGEVNWNYVEREITWYESQSLNVNDIPGGVPKIWQQVSSSAGFINSNYGWAIWSEENNNQFQNVIEELTERPFSRRAVMIYTRPSMWNDYNVDGMSDFMCTNAVQYFIRKNKLHCVVQMRSNDVVFGYKNDRAWQMYVLNKMCSKLRIDRGNIYWNVGSLHVYERHFNLVK